MRNLFAGSAMVALAIGASAPAFAQEVSSSITGTVTAAGAPVAGAQVTIKHVPSGTTTNTTTDSSGQYNASGLRIGGPFSVKISAPGFADTEITDINLIAGTPLRLPIDVAPQGQEIVVKGTATKAVNLSAGPAIVLNRTQIQGVASVNRDIRDLARRDPMVSLDPTNSRAIEVAGQQGRFNKFSVDGINFSDNFGLNNGGLPTNRGPVPLDAIEQFSVKVAPYDISEGNFQGGAINVVLRSGGNQFHGTGFYTYSDDGLLGDKTKNIDTAFKVKSKNYGGFLSGPIIKDKLFFAFAYEGLNETTPPDILNNQIPNFNQSLIDSVSSTAQSRYDYDPGNSFTSVKEHDKKYTAKLDWNITDGQRLSATYIRNEGTRGFQQGTSTSVSSPGYGYSSNAYALGETVNSGTLDLNSDWADNFHTEVRGNYRKYVRTQVSDGDLGQGQFTICSDAISTGSLTQCTQGGGTTPGSLRLIYGPDPSRQTNILNTESYGGDVTLRWTQGNHNLKLIGSYQHLKVFDLFVQNSLGSWYFDSLADYQAGRADQLQYGGSTSGNINDAAAAYSYGQFYFAAQDSWDVNSALNITGGVRYDLSAQRDEPALNNFFVQRYGYANTKNYDGLGVFQPRVGVTYKPVRRLTIRGGGGLFAGTSPDVWLANSFQNSGVYANSLTISRTATGCTGVPANLCSALNNVGPGAAIPAALTQYLQTNVGALSAAPVNSLAPNFKPPSTWKANLSADYKLDFDNFLGHGWGIGADFYYSHVNNATDYTDLRSVVIGTDPDGRPRYGTIGGGTNTNADLQVVNTHKGRSYIWSVRGSKDFDFGLSTSIAYTHQDVKDVSPVTSSTASSNYGNSAMVDPNHSAYGISEYQIKNSLKFSLDFNHAFFGDYKTRFDLFGERRSGRPFSYTMNDSATTRSSVFGTVGTSNRYLLYVPNVSSITADPLVSYDNATTFANLQNIVQNSVLNKYQGKIAPKNIGTSPHYFKVDLHVGQEIPAPFVPTGRFEVFADMENVLNMLNKNWGSLQQVAFPYLASVVNVTCATSTASGSCGQYKYSNATAPNVVNNTRYSLWQIRVGARFSF